MAKPLATLKQQIQTFFLFRQVYMSNKFLLYTQITSLKFDHFIFQVISGGLGQIANFTLEKGRQNLINAKMF